MSVTAPKPERRTSRIFSKTFVGLWTIERPSWWGDAIVLLGLVVLLYVGVRLAFGAPAAIRGRGISRSPGVLPYYAALSLGRMAAAYGLSLAFTLIYGYKPRSIGALDVSFSRCSTYFKAYQSYRFCQWCSSA